MHYCLLYLVLLVCTMSSSLAFLLTTAGRSRQAAVSRQFPSTTFRKPTPGISSLVQRNNVWMTSQRGMSTEVAGTFSSSSNNKRRVLSGVQPTGVLHIGNYLGALKQWVDVQHTHDSLFCVVNMHAITVPHNPAQLREDTLNTVALYLACGIDPSISKIFVQSKVRQHAELTWLLNCITPLSWLERMVQYKEKSQQRDGTDSVSAGLLNYPVLMAADILLYQTDLVPVGEDQRQHLELTRDIYRRFNDLFLNDKSNTRKGKLKINQAAPPDRNGDSGEQQQIRSVFREPSTLTCAEGARIMSLLDGTSKMSKSAISDDSRINLMDSNDVIAKKIKRCKTDAIKGLEWNNPNRPEATNLLNLFQAVSGKSKDEIENEASALSWGTFKPLLADAVIDHIAPIRDRYQEIHKDRAYVEQVLREGEETAGAIAEDTIKGVKEAMGIL